MNLARKSLTSNFYCNSEPGLKSSVQKQMTGLFRFYQNHLFFLVSKLIRSPEAASHLKVTIRVLLQNRALIILSGLN